MAELKKYLNERGLREVWDIINGQNSLIVSKIKDIQKRTTVGLYADSTSGWEESESKISEAGALYIYTDAETFNGKVIAKVKIGDGTSSLADLSFIDAPYSAHIADRDIHFTAEERAQWNNEISAFVTAAEESANTAGEAANRAETAKTAAETARDTAVSAKERAKAAEANASQFEYRAEKYANDAKGSEQNAAKSAERAAGAEQGAISNANKAGDYAIKSGDSANNADIAANRAQELVSQAGGQADRATIAANRSETAAQTAQSIADSLPDDYVTAVGKIAENTAEISAVKLTDKELQRRVDALYSIGQGITHRFETDSETAYAKTVPTGGKLMSVKNIGGRSIVFNQIFEMDSNTNYGVTVTADSDGTITINGTTTASFINFRNITPEQNKIGKYMFKLLILNNPDNIEMSFGFLNRNSLTPSITSGSSAVIYNQTQYEISRGNTTGIEGFKVGTVFNDVKIKVQIFDLTLMFGSGKEPSTVEEFKAIFPNDYYSYNAGEIVSAGTESVVEQGKNLFDIKKCVKLNSYYGFEIDTNKTLQIDLKDGKTCPTNVSFGIVYVHGNTMANQLITSNGVRETITNSRDMTGSTQIMVACYPGNKKTMQSIADAFDIMLVDGIYKLDTMPAYAPYHSNVYPIPEAIKALPGYGWSAGTAKNYVDYENKRYVQCVDSVDLGTLTWHIGDRVSFETFQLKGQKLTRNYDIAPNILCSKYLTKTQSQLWGKTNVTGITTNANVDGCVHLNDTTYTDVATFTQAMQGVMLYYELANPIVTDISSLIPDDFLRNIEVEAGGSVTFRNGNGDSYRIPVPSEEEYIVKLSEVGGTT